MRAILASFTLAIAYAFSITAFAANRHELYQMAKNIEESLPWSNMTSEQMSQAEKHLQAVLDLIVEATPIPASLSISDSAVFDFGSVVIGGSFDHTFTITNNGSQPATRLAANPLAAPFSFKGGTFPGTGGTCFRVLDAGATCTVVVTFAPTMMGSQSTTLALEYNDGSNLQTTVRSIQGVSTAPAFLSVSDGATFSFESVSIGDSATHAFTISNLGGAVATAISGSGLSAPITFKGGTYPGIGGTCVTTLAAGANCSIVISFSPTTRMPAIATLNLNFYDGAATQTSVRTVTGKGR